MNAFSPFGLIQLLISYAKELPRWRSFEITYFLSINMFISKYYNQKLWVKFTFIAVYIQLEQKPFYALTFSFTGDIFTEL